MQHAHITDDLRNRVARAIRLQAWPEELPLHLFESLLEANPQDAYQPEPPDSVRELLDWWANHHVLNCEVYGVPDER